jgi:hypothetical protein
MCWLTKRWYVVHCCRASCSLVGWMSITLWKWFDRLVPKSCLFLGIISIPVIIWDKRGNTSGRCSNWKLALLTRRRLIGRLSKLRWENA